MLQVQIRLTHKQVAELAEQYKSGRSVRDLVEHWGINRGTVRGHLERQGIARRPAVRKLTDQDVASAARHYASGDSLTTIGERFGVHSETIRREFKKAGVTVRPRP